VQFAMTVPTVSDRVAQTVVKLMIEPILEPIFHKDSYGSRPGRSAKQAVAVTRERCWKYDWVVEFDIKAAFAEIFKLVVASTNKFQAAFLSWLGRCGAARWLSM
jgi:RNA-directed DNA polymerase